jgi:malic enzyme
VLQANAILMPTKRLTRFRHCLLRTCIQANNAYVFPAVGHAAVLTRAKTIPNDVFLVAAEALAGKRAVLYCEFQSPQGCLQQQQHSQLVCHSL